MYLAYYDESGDDGFPKYSSPIFTLSAIYFNAKDWRNNVDVLHEFRKWASKAYGLPTKLEIHTKDFIENKHPYRNLGLSDQDRITILDNYVIAIAGTKSRVVNVVINKTVIRKRDYNVLDYAFSYSIQRIDNDIDDMQENFMIITDEGRLPKMRKTVRRLQVFNPIPSKYDNSVLAYRPIDRLLEDPLPKNSTSSYLVQVSDFMAFLIYSYMINKLAIRSLANRLPIDNANIVSWLNNLTPILNMKASTGNEHGYGIVCYPKS